jgi:hypothetical protein
MAVGGNVAPSGAVLAFGVGVDGLLAALAEAQTVSVNVSEEGVVADAAPGDESCSLPSRVASASRQRR